MVEQISMEEARTLGGRGHKAKGYGDFYAGVEASEYFAKTKNDSPFASNRFSDKEAKAAAQQLVDAGGKVFVSGIMAEPDRIESEGDVYADTFIVTGRGKKLSIAFTKLRPDEFDEVAPDVYRLWWD
jgi:hypothetical protein